MEKAPECLGCPFERVGKGFVAPDPLTADTQLIVYGESPGAEEVQAGRGFVGRAGRVLRRAEGMAGLEMPWPELDGQGRTTCAEGGPVVHANVLLCQPPGNVFPPRKVADECWRRHRKRHETLRRSEHPVVAVGEHARQALSDLQPVDGITDERGGWWPHKEEGWFLATIHPSFVARGGGPEEEGGAQVDWLPMLAWDLQKAIQGKPGLPEVRLVGARELASLLPGIPAGTLVAADLEGDDRPALVGLSWEPGVAWVAWADGGVLAGPLGELFRSPNVQTCWHNATFDLSLLKRAWGVDPPAQWVDTMVYASTLNPSLKLRLQAQVLCHVPESLPWKGLRGGTEGDGPNSQRRAHNRLRRELGRYEIPLDSFRKWYVWYNGLDAAWTLKLAHSLRQRMSGRGYYQEAAQPLQRPLLELGWSGLPVDVRTAQGHRQRLLEREQEARRRVERVGEEARERQTDGLRLQIATLLEARREEAERHKQAGGKGRPAFSKAKTLAGLRAKLNASNDGFNIDSPRQRAQLVEFLGLRPARGGTRRSTPKPTLDDHAIEDLLARVDSGRLKPTGVSTDVARQVLAGLVELSQLSGWRKLYVERTLKQTDGKWNPKQDAE